MFIFERIDVGSEQFMKRGDEKKRLKKLYTLRKIIWYLPYLHFSPNKINFSILTSIPYITNLNKIQTWTKPTLKTYYFSTKKIKSFLTTPIKSKSSNSSSPEIAPNSKSPKLKPHPSSILFKICAWLLSQSQKYYKFFVS